jgi:hypothetical protein
VKPALSATSAYISRSTAFATTRARPMPN